MSTVIFVGVVAAEVAADVNTRSGTNTISPNITIIQRRSTTTGRISAAPITGYHPAHQRPTNTGIGIARAAAGVESPESRRAYII